MKNSTCKIVNGQILKKRQILGLIQGFRKEPKDQRWEIEEEFLHHFGCDVYAQLGAGCRDRNDTASTVDVNLRKLLTIESLPISIFKMY